MLASPQALCQSQAFLQPADYAKLWKRLLYLLCSRHHVIRRCNATSKILLGRWGACNICMHNAWTWELHLSDTSCFALSLVWQDSKCSQSSVILYQFVMWTFLEKNSVISFAARLFVSVDTSAGLPKCISWSHDKPYSQWLRQQLDLHHSLLRSPLWWSSFFAWEQCCLIPLPLIQLAWQLQNRI